MDTKGQYILSTGFVTVSGGDLLRLESEIVLLDVVEDCGDFASSMYAHAFVLVSQDGTATYCSRDSSNGMTDEEFISFLPKILVGTWSRDLFSFDTLLTFLCLSVGDMLYIERGGILSTLGTKPSFFRYVENNVETTVYLMPKPQFLHLDNTHSSITSYIQNGDECFLTSEVGLLYRVPQQILDILLNLVPLEIHVLREVRPAFGCSLCNKLDGGAVFLRCESEVRILCISDASVLFVEPSGCLHLDRSYSKLCKKRVLSSISIWMQGSCCLTGFV